MKEKIGKREKIIRSAMALLTKHGFHAAPMSMIANKAGVAAGTIYTYFRSKDVLIEAISQEIQNDIINYLKKNMPESDTAKEKFVNFYTSLLSYLTAKPLHFRYLEQYHNSPYGISLRRDVLTGNKNDLSPLTEIINEGISKKEIEVKDMPFPLLLAHVFGPLLVIARDNALGFFKTDKTQIRTSAEACWDSLKK